MCGIAGILNLNFKPVDFEVLKNMSDAQKHRGPDDQGFVGFSFKKNKILPINIRNGMIESGSFHGGIGFNRLSILDLSINGHQPMISQNEKVVIAYNGETYNAFQFKSDLKKKGFIFKSKTDTEILLYLYQQYGIEKMLELTNGMFAFCIVDLELQKVFLACDHAGIKPMYWYKNRNTILFGSEIKSFLSHPKFEREIDKSHIDEYLYFKYCAHDRTLFKGVSQMPPGHYLEISTDGEKLIKYWEPKLNTFDSLSKKNALERLESALKASVKSQLISDVKVGCQLSGGIDSSLVTTYARQYFNAFLDTFSIIFENKKYSEEKYIDQVINNTKSRAHKFDLTPEYFVKNVVSATWHMDVPLPIPQAVGIKRLAERSSEFVTVLLSGEGSDELMGGYPRFYDLVNKIGRPLMIYLYSKVPIRGKIIDSHFLPKLPAKDYFIKHKAANQYNEYKYYRPEANFDIMLNQHKQLFPNHNDLLKTARVYNMQGWLVNLLNIQDKMTMAHSIENRVPFLDKDVINLVFSLPSDYFIRSGKHPLKFNLPNRHTKILLKKLAKRYFNKDFVYREKIGFKQPMHDYFAQPEMIEFVNDLILPGIMKRGIFDYKQINNAWKLINQPNDHSLFWSCFGFELWAQVFIDKSMKA